MLETLDLCVPERANGLAITLTRRRLTPQSQMRSRHARNQILRS